MRRSVARQSASVLKLSMGQCSEFCTGLKAPTAIISRRRRGCLRINGCSDQNRRHDGDPAIAGRDPGQAGEPHDDALRRRQHGKEMNLDAPVLIGLAVEEGDGIDVLIDAHHREAQVRLALIALGIALD